MTTLDGDGRCGDAIASCAAAMRDPRTNPKATKAQGFTRDQMLRRWSCRSRQQAAVCCIMAFAWNGDESLSARPARKTSLFGTPGMESGRDEKARSVVALSRVPRLAGFAGSPPAAGFFWRLTGLLSGSPPTDTRPQARAKLGKPIDRRICRDYKIFFDPRFSSVPIDTWCCMRALSSRRLNASSRKRVAGKLPDCSDRKTRQCFDVARFLTGRMIPSDWKAR